MNGAIPVESLQHIGVLTKASAYMSALGFQGTNSNGTAPHTGSELSSSSVVEPLVEHENVTQTFTSKGSRSLQNLNSRLFNPTQAFLAKSKGSTPVQSKPSHSKDGMTDNHNHNSKDGQEQISPSSAKAGSKTESLSPSKLFSLGRQQRSSVSEKSKSGENRVSKPEWDASGRRRVTESSPSDKPAKSNSDSVSRLSASKKVSVTAKSGRQELRSLSPSGNSRSRGSDSGREGLAVSGNDAVSPEPRRSTREKLFSRKSSKSSNNNAEKTSNQQKSQETSRSTEARHSEKSSNSMRVRSSSVDGSKAERKGRRLSDASESHSGEVGVSRHYISSNERSRENSGHGSADSTKLSQGRDMHEDSGRRNHLAIGTPRDSGLKGWNVSEGKEGSRWSEGENSPVSILDLVLSDDVISPANSLDGRRHSIGEGSPAVLSGMNLEGRPREEDCMLDFQRHLLDSGGNDMNLTNSQSKMTSVYDSVESLEFASLDFIGEVEGMEQDLEYVRHILVVSGFGAERLPPWHSNQLPMNPAVFEELELGIALGANAGRPSMDVVRRNEERRQRMLLFDAVNEALGRRLAPFVKLPPWITREKPTVRPRPAGKELLQEVWLEVHDWPVPTSDEVYDILDDAARRDMTRGLEKWTEIGEERAEVVFELEGMIMQDLLEEMVLEFTAAEGHFRRREPLISQLSLGSSM